ncbi:uncharacterized protein A4U43_C07F10720 [Asparagus officinalis]|uniref:Uncharacterized protein n=1 Tax=Asparagus officinalis TaxID=4686 RepID=A0A5P1EAX4_ASPOF|nr:uncharacterized protein A4U43_C07F10720 [Asparagus officinalis]
MIPIYLSFTTPSKLVVPRILSVTPPLKLVVNYSIEARHPLKVVVSRRSSFTPPSTVFPLELSKCHLPLTFKTPPVSPLRQNYLTGLRRICSLEFRPNIIISPESGLVDPLLSSVGSSGASESLLPQSTTYNWSCGHFSRPLLMTTDDNEEIIARREDRERIALDRIAKFQHYSVSKLNNQIASWDIKFEMSTKTTLLLPFSLIVVAADENERIR